MSRLSIGQRWVLLGCALLAGVVRSLPWRNFLDRDGAYLFYGPDSYDHLRRITLGMKAFPAIPSFDAYYGYPVGTGQIWSPGFDYLLSLAALLVGGSLDAPAAAHFIGFWLPPLLAMVTIVLVHRVTNMLYGPFAAGVAALLLALLPG